MSDKYLSQDLENRFESIFFQNNNYRGPGVPVKTITLINQVVENKKIKDFRFSIYWVGEDHVTFSYDSEQECSKDRNRLLMQIEAFYSRGDLKEGG